MMDVSALFVMPDSIYKQIGVDSWDENRDALKWPGGNSVVAHPPCRLWGRLRQFSTAPESEKELATWAVDQVRKYGGVLEHPAHSTLWPHKGLPGPGQPADKYGGYSLCIDQFWWGHLAKKKTFLYIVGCPMRSIPEYSIRFDAVCHVVSSLGNKTPKKEITKKARKATPENFARWLIEIAKICNKNINESSTDNTEPGHAQRVG